MKRKSYMVRLTDNSGEWLDRLEDIPTRADATDQAHAALMNNAHRAVVIEVREVEAFARSVMEVW